jgi:FkbM family methyltransferase
MKTKHKIALANLVQTLVMTTRRLAGKGSTVRTRRNGIEWELDLREGIDFSIWLLGSFEPETVRCYQGIVKPGDVVLDIGANIGAHAMLLARAVGEDGKVYAFEPTDYAYAKLSQNRMLNPGLAGRIHCMQYMLVDDRVAGKPAPDLYSSWPLKDDATLHQLHQGRLMSTSGAEARTLDSVIESLKVDRVDFIKLDIDGFECGMLRGANKALNRWRPPIIMELAPYALEEQGESLANLLALLRKHGYSLFDLSADSSLVMDSASLAKRIPDGSSLNVIARS